MLVVHGTDPRLYAPSITSQSRISKIPPPHARGAVPPYRGGYLCRHTPKTEPVFREGRTHGLGGGRSAMSVPTAISHFVAIHLVRCWHEAAVRLGGCSARSSFHTTRPTGDIGRTAFAERKISNI